jgi:hypothetical protein
MWLQPARDGRSRRNTFSPRTEEPKLERQLERQPQQVRSLISKPIERTEEQERGVRQAMALIEIENALAEQEAAKTDAAEQARTQARQSFTRTSIGRLIGGR